MLSQEAIEKILGIEESVPISAEEMADKMNIFFCLTNKVGGGYAICRCQV